jgi:hypothetical protein
MREVLPRFEWTTLKVLSQLVEHISQLAKTSCANGNSRSSKRPIRSPRSSPTDCNATAMSLVQRYQIVTKNAVRFAPAGNKSSRKSLDLRLILQARPTGFEPATLGSTVRWTRFRRSIGPQLHSSAKFQQNVGCGSNIAKRTAARTSRRPDSISNSTFTQASQIGIGDTTTPRLNKSMNGSQLVL